MYRDDEAPLRAELEDLQRELRGARKDHAELVQRIESVRDRERRLRRLAHPRWSRLCAGVPILALVAAAHWRSFGSSPPASRQLDPEVVRLRSELANAQSEARSVLEQIDEARAKGGQDPRMLDILAATRTLDARRRSEAWQIVAGAACMRGDRALLVRARDHAADAGAAPVFRACDALGSRAP